MHTGRKRFYNQSYKFMQEVYYGFSIASAFGIYFELQHDTGSGCMMIVNFREVWYRKGPCCIDTVGRREVREYDDDMDR